MATLPLPSHTLERNTYYPLLFNTVQEPDGGFFLPPPLYNAPLQSAGDEICAAPAQWQSLSAHVGCCECTMEETPLKANLCLASFSRHELFCAMQLFVTSV